MMYPGMAGMPAGMPAGAGNIHINIEKPNTDALIKTLDRWTKNHNNSGHEDHEPRTHDRPRGEPPSLKHPHHEDLDFEDDYEPRIGGGHGRHNHRGSLSFDDHDEEDIHPHMGVTARDEDMLRKAFHAEPDDTDRRVRALAEERVDQLEPLSGGPRHIRGAEDLEHFSKTMNEAAEKMEDTVPTIQKHRDAAVDGMLDMNEKMLEWRQHLTEQTTGLNDIQERVDGLEKTAKRHWEDDEKKRMEMFDSLVDNGEGGLDCVGHGCGQFRSDHVSGKSDFLE